MIPLCLYWVSPCPREISFNILDQLQARSSKRRNNCNVLYDLPPENALRKELSKMKAKLEEFVDKLLALEL